MTTAGHLTAPYPSPRSDSVFSASMSHLIKALILLAALINLAPIVGALSSDRLQALYGIPIDGPDLEILLRHRAVLFGLVGALLAIAAFHPPLRTVAYAAGFISMVSFVAVLRLVGNANANLSRVEFVDWIGIVALLAAVVLDRFVADSPWRSKGRESWLSSAVRHQQAHRRCQPAVVSSAGLGRGDRQLVPAEWVAESTRSHAEAEFGLDWGSMWWVSEDGRACPDFDAGGPVFMARGTGGHTVLMVPHRDLVVVHRVNSVMPNPAKYVAARDLGRLLQSILDSKVDGP